MSGGGGCAHDIIPPNNDATRPDPMTTRVLQLTPADVPRIRELNALFGEAFSDRATYGARPPDDAYVAGLLAKDHVIVLTALESDTVVGGLVAYQLHKFESARSEIYIYDLAVADTHRRRGIGTALIERLRAIAAARDAWVIFVQGDYGDDPALALYDKLGTREEVLHFDIAVPKRQR
jgi:aminoglycoside 3-N-acetyltransferase I